MYREISKEIVTPRASKELLLDLDKLAQCYHDISNPADNNGFTDDKLIKSLESIRMLKARSFYPVVLAMKRAETKFSEKDIRVVVETIEVYVYRNFTICGKVANKAEVFFADIARNIFNETYTTVDIICDVIRGGIVSNKEFEESFDVWSGNKSSKDMIRYTLRKIHQHLDSLNEINIDNNEVHIEHIMPEDNTLWKVDQEEHDAFLWRLGNLALISGKINIPMSNKVFAEKKPQFDMSVIKPNDEIINYEQWTSTEIEDRQRRLAKYALEIWKK